MTENSNPKHIMGSEIRQPMEPWSNLDGTIVMVTGASSGLGRNFCLDLAKAGCRIVAVARRINMLNSLCDQINKGGSCRAVAVVLDITADGKGIEECVEKAWDAFGRIDVLINNAGVRGPKRVSVDLSEEEWTNVMKTNLTGSWLVSKYVGARMRGGGRGGSIINISSTFGLNRVQFGGSVSYSSSKSGLDSMTRTMAVELGDYNIKVNSIAAGLFESEMTEGLFKDNLLEKMVQTTVPMRSFGTTDPALTSLVRYLVHGFSRSYVTGNVFIVDAGATLPGFPIFSSL